MAKQELKTTQTQVKSPIGEGNQLEHTLTVDDNCLPSPADLAKYKEVDPRIISFIIETTKKEQDFRHDFERKKLKTYDKIGRRDFRLDLWGLTFGAVVMLAGLGLAAWLAACDKIVTGTIFGGSTIIIAAIAFIRRAKHDEAEQTNTKKRK